MMKSIFLDRDGVINPLVYNVDTCEYESPHYVEDFSVFPYVSKSIQLLQSLGFQLFVVTNQPSYAKGKTSLENIKEIHNVMDVYFKEQGINFTDYYYCYHHPNGIVPEYTAVCECRKPKNRFLIDAHSKYEVDYKNSWFVGDQDSDVECGKSKGVKTILITNKHSSMKRGKSAPDYLANNLFEAVHIIIKNEGKSSETC